MKPGMNAAKDRTCTARTVYVVLLSIWMAVISLGICWGLIEIWPKAAIAMAPSEMATGLAVNPSNDVTQPGGQPGSGANPKGQEVDSGEPILESKGGLPLGRDGTILVVIFLLGAGGAQIHAIQSFSDYLGNGSFSLRWAFWYMKRPIVGALLALTVYAGIGGGFMGLDAVTGQNGGNLWGLTSICLLTGMFSRLVTDKLYEVVSNLLMVRPGAEIERKDKLDAPRADSPEVQQLIPASFKASKPVAVRIVGRSFTSNSTVRIGEENVEADFISPTEFLIPVSALPKAKGIYNLIVTRGDSTQSSQPAKLEVTE